MKTECKSNQLKFHPLLSRDVIVKFDGGNITSDGGALLLREVEKRTHILKRLSHCFKDFRNPDMIEHTVEELIKQRICGIAMGYEDLNDHEILRHDSLLGLLCDKEDPSGLNRQRERDKGKATAGKSTLNRFELTPENEEGVSRYKKIIACPEEIDDLLVTVFMESYEEPPEEIILDLDATDDTLYGSQEGRFFHGYYKHYCYLPLYIFCGEQLLCARLRTADRDASDGSIEELEHIVKRLREKWPHTRIIIRGDSGFCRNAIMDWCETNNIDYVLGLAKNKRLKDIIVEEMEESKNLYEKTGHAARIFKDFRYQTLKSWSKERRVVGKAEYLKQGENPRFIVSSLQEESWRASCLYERLYCARGEMENRIKEQQLYLFADRTSTAMMRSNQLRLYFSSFAYVLMQWLRQFALKGTEMAKFQCSTIRLKLFKIGAQIRLSVRKIWISMSQGYPFAEILEMILAKLYQIPIRI